MISGLSSGFFGRNCVLQDATSVYLAGSADSTTYDNLVTVEEVLLAAGEQVGHDHLSFASQMNKAVVVFLKDKSHVYKLIESGAFIMDAFVQVSPLSIPSTSPVFHHSHLTSC